MAVFKLAEADHEPLKITFSSGVSPIESLFYRNTEHFDTTVSVKYINFDKITTCFEFEMMDTVRTRCFVHIFQNRACTRAGGFR